MIRKWFGITALVVATASVFSLSGCAHNTHLVSIAIQPGDGTFAAADPSLSFQYRAYGTYIHPPKTVDITDQVIWQSSAPQVAQFTGPGTISPNTNCGVTQIFATMHDSPNDVVSNEVSVTVDGPASLGCPTGSATSNLIISMTNGTDGTVVSSPAGISCGNACQATFPTGTPISLTATAVLGKAFNGYTSGCTPTSAGSTICNLILNSDTTVVASFN